MTWQAVFENPRQRVRYQVRFLPYAGSPWGDDWTERSFTSLAKAQDFVNELKASSEVEEVSLTKWSGWSQYLIDTWEYGEEKS